MKRIKMLTVFLVGWTISFVIFGALLVDMKISLPLNTIMLVMTGFVVWKVFAPREEDDNDLAG